MRWMSRAGARIGAVAWVNPSSLSPRERLPAAAAARDELIEVALLSAEGLVLDQQREIVVVEFFEPLVPIDRAERIRAAVAGEIQAEHPRVTAAAGAHDAGGLCVSLLGPSADFIVVSQHLRALCR